MGTGSPSIPGSFAAPTYYKERIIQGYLYMTELIRTRVVTALTGVLFVCLAGCGGGGGSGGDDQAPVVDTTPDEFSFPPIVNASPAVWVESSPVTITGINMSVNVSVEGGEYAIDGGEFTASEGEVESGQSITLRVYSSETLGQEVLANISVGDAEADLSVTTKTEATPPAIAISFPNKPDYIAYEEEFVVTGIATDNVAVERVIVNGVEATSVDQFATWSARIPLAEAQVNDIRAVAYDTSENSATAKSAIITTLGYESAQCGAVAYDPAGDIAYIIAHEKLATWDFKNQKYTVTETDAPPRGLAFDGRRNALYSLVYEKSLFSIDPVTGESELISADGTDGIYYGDGGTPLISVDENSGLVYAFSDIGPKIFSINPDTGERKIVADETKGTGDAIPWWVDFVVDDGRIFYMSKNGYEGVLYEVDANTGDRLLISGSVRGAGPAIPQLGKGALAVDVASNSAYMMANFKDFYRIDLTTGDRTLVSDGSDWQDEYFLADTRIDDRIGFDAEEGVMIIPECRSGDFFSVNVASGDRVKLNPGRRGQGADYTSSSEIVYSPATKKLLSAMGSGLSGAILATDITTGDRKVLSASTIGNGGYLPWADSLAVDAPGETIYLVSGYKIYAIDAYTGDKTLLGSTRDGKGVNIEWGFGADFDDLNGQLVVADYLADSLVAIDPADGFKRTLSSSSIGTGQDIVEPRHVVVDEDNGVVYATSNHYLFAVDLGTGDREVILDTSQMADFSIGWISRMVFDREGQRLVANLNGGSSELVEVNLQSRSYTIHDVTGISSRPLGLAIDNDTGFIYGADVFDSYISIINGQLSSGAVFSQ